MSLIEEIEKLQDERRVLVKNIAEIDQKISAIRQSCKHKFEHTHTYGDGDWEYTCSNCGYSYIH